MGSIAQELTKAKKIAANIVEETRTAIALLSAWDRCANKADILEPLKNTYEAHTFQLIRNSIHINLIMALMRIHDADISDNSSLSNLVNIVSKEEIKNRMANDTRKSIMKMAVSSIGLTDDEMIEQVRKEHAENAVTRDAETLEDAINAFQSLPSKEILTKLKKLRNKVLAHRSVNPVVHGVKYGEEAKILTDTLPIVQKLCSALLGTHYDFDSSKRIWDKYADCFWTRLVKS